MSEFYQLRRNTIKDVAGYLGFVLGFFGSGPLAWPYLVSQSDGGDFAKGVAFFLAVITVGGLFGGAIGMALGAGIGSFWERVHRAMRRAPAAETSSNAAASTLPPRAPSRTPARLPPAALAGRRLDSVTFRGGEIDLRLDSALVRTTHATPVENGVRHPLPEPGSRDALCALIGTRVESAGDAGGILSLHFGKGRAVEIPWESALIIDGAGR